MKNEKLYISVILCFLGIILTTIMTGISNIVGIIFIAIGGIYFILGIREMKKYKESKK